MWPAGYLPPAVRRATTRLAPALGVLVLALTALLSAAPAQASSVRVPAGYYGVNFQRLANLGPAAQDTQLSSIASLGINQVRFNVSWASVEPEAPKNGVHNYRWGSTDQQIAAMARHGIRAATDADADAGLERAAGHLGRAAVRQGVQPLAGHRRAVRPLRRAFAGRYGRNGSFWAAHPEPPLRAGASLRGLERAEPEGRLVPASAAVALRGHVRGRRAGAARRRPRRLRVHGRSGASLGQECGQPRAVPRRRRVLWQRDCRQPNLNSYMSAAAVHIYPGTDGSKQLEKLAWFRSQLRDGRIANRIPMIVNEIGWATHVGKAPITESERAAAFGKMSINYARTNCNVGGHPAPHLDQPAAERQQPGGLVRDRGPEHRCAVRLGERTTPTACS